MCPEHSSFKLFCLCKAFLFQSLPRSAIISVFVLKHSFFKSLLNFCKAYMFQEFSEGLVSTYVYVSAESSKAFNTLSKIFTLD